MNEMLKSIKEIHKNDVCIYKVGNFYHTLNRDAYIISYLMGYKIRDEKEGIKECGFSANVINKVLVKLENNKINYLLLDRRNNYEVDERVNFKNLNNYSEVFEKANKYINHKRRINNISEYLTKHIENKDMSKLLSELEKVIIDYERRKV